MEGPAHLLSLKVMRISRPQLAGAWQPFFSSSPSFSAHSSASILSLQGSVPLDGHPKTLRDLTNPVQLLTLPAAFGTIQLGESFAACLAINNDTLSPVHDVRVKIEMQTAVIKIVLADTDLPRTVAPGDALELVVQHEIKELGQHVLGCTVTYRLSQNAHAVPGAAEDSADPELMTFRKFYKFNVTNPLSVKTKVHASKSPSALMSPLERDKVFLEVHIQNLTQDSICFERMRLESVEGWTAQDANILPPSSTDPNSVSIFSGDQALLQPQDTRQYIYILTPTDIQHFPPPVPVPGSIIPLGRLDITWRSPFGEPARLLTSVLSRRIPLAPSPPPYVAPAPASALPSYLKRGTISRPQSPALSPSRPDTPPARIPPSPSLSHTMSSTLPSQGYTHSPLEVALIVRHVPRNLEPGMSFDIECAVVIKSAAPAENMKRVVGLAVQHLEAPRVSAANVLHAMKGLSTGATIVTGAQSPREHGLTISSGFATPSGVVTPLASADTSHATFNYALAHNKILAASPARTRASIERGAGLHELGHAKMASDGTDVQLPPPYFTRKEELASVRGSPGVIFVGPSVLFLPTVEMRAIVSVQVRASAASESVASPPVSSSAIAHPQSFTAQATLTFMLSYAAVRRGFHAIGGLRVLLVEDHVDEAGEDSEKNREPVRERADANDSVGGRGRRLKRAQVLKEVDVLVEVWV